LPFLALLWAALVPYFTGFSVDLLDKLSFAAFSAVLTQPRLWSASFNSDVVALTATFGLALLALVIARVVIRARSRYAWLVDAMAMLPLGIPHLTLGVALIFLFFSFRAIPLYGTIWLIAIAHVIAYLPVASRMMQAGMMQISSELEEASQVAGASLLQNLRRIVVPLLTPTFAALAIWMIVHSVREFSIAVMLQSGHNEVLSTYLYSYWATSAPERAAAVAVLLMAALFVLVALSNRLMRRTVEG
jgi:iron(III) transport system permease protein